MSIEGDIWITMTQLRRQIHRLLRDLDRGRTFTITRRARPVARLIAGR